MKGYKDFKKVQLGGSDIATLILSGFNAGNIQLKSLSFGGDGAYEGYFVNEETEIPAHYTLCAEFESWLSIYDDLELVLRVEAPKIQIYRAGAYGCIIYAPNGIAKQKTFTDGVVTRWANI